MMRTVITTSRSVATTVVVAALASLALLLIAGPSDAEENGAPPCGERVDGALVICVTDTGYVPAAVEVEAGERIRWVWVDDGEYVLLTSGHSVRAEPDDEGRIAFDSEAACQAEDPQDCRRSGHTYSWEARAGTYSYYCSIARGSSGRSDMTGTIQVAPAPSPEPSPQPSPSPEPSPDSSPDPDNGDEEEATDEEAADDDGSGQEASSTPRRAQQRSAPRMTQRSRPLETPSAEMSAEAAPEVAAPEATFEPFPSPEPLPASDDDDLGELTIEASDGPFTPTRTQWLGLALASLALSVGAFTKVVFLGGTFG